MAHKWKLGLEWPNLIIALLSFYITVIFFVFDAISLHLGCSLKFLFYSCLIIYSAIGIVFRPIIFTHVGSSTLQSDQSKYLSLPMCSVNDQDHWIFFRSVYYFFNSPWFGKQNLSFVTLNEKKKELSASQNGKSLICCTQNSHKPDVACTVHTKTSLLYTPLRIFLFKHQKNKHISGIFHR